MTLDKDEMQLVAQHLETIKIILTNNSCSVLTPEFRNAMNTIARAHNIDFCRSCNSGMVKLCQIVQTAYDAEVQNKTKKSKKSEKSEKSE